MSITVCPGCKTKFEQSPENFSSICPACKIKTDIKLLELGRAAFLTFGLIAVGMFIPFLLIPLTQGTDAAGIYSMTNKKGGVIHFTGTTLFILNSLTLAAAVGCLCLSEFFKRKHTESKSTYHNVSGKRPF